jgi:hypothetical protein
VIDGACNDFRLKQAILWDNEADGYVYPFSIPAAFDHDCHLLGWLCGLDWKLD